MEFLGRPEAPTHVLSSGSLISSTCLPRRISSRSSPGTLGSNHGQYPALNKLLWIWAYPLPSAWNALLPPGHIHHSPRPSSNATSSGKPSSIPFSSGCQTSLPETYSQEIAFTLQYNKYITKTTVLGNTI